MSYYEKKRVSLSLRDRYIISEMGYDKDSYDFRVTDAQSLQHLRSSRQSKAYLEMDALIDDEFYRGLRGKSKKTFEDVVVRLVVCVGRKGDAEHVRLALLERKVKRYSNAKLRRLLLIEGCA